ncbi:hypothetical protein, unknown function [Leishmania tarentolae]|uniref:Uncharacterized protein n=1 Tax=Leishmania tarentolae TaxID=5689 RepID=A0A640KUC6_LEITA|nr:hypothetical protein, unknown function [Leishmania tarentolae]
MSPPPRLPVTFTLGGARIGARPRGSYAERVYEESDQIEDDEVTDEESDVGESVDGADYCGVDYSDEDRELSERRPAGNDNAASEGLCEDTRALHVDVKARNAAPTADAHPVDRYDCTSGEKADPSVSMQRSIAAAMYASTASVYATKAAPATASAFRRATPVARVAYSVGYDHGVGGSSADSFSASPQRDDSASMLPTAVEEAAGVLEGASAKRTTTDTIRNATPGGPDKTAIPKSFGYSMGDANTMPSVSAQYMPEGPIARSDAGNRVSSNRHLCSSSAFTSIRHVSEIAPAHGRKSNSKESMPRVLDHQCSSTTSSPLSPQRPTVGAGNDRLVHGGDNHALARGCDSTRTSPVLALGESADALNSDGEEGAERRAPTDSTMALHISVTNVFNYSETERCWLSGGESSTLPVCAAQRSESENGLKGLPATTRSLTQSLLPLPASAVKVSLYCRPLLVQLPSPSLHMSILSAAGNSTLVRVALVLLYYAPRALVTSVLWGLIRLAVVLVVLTTVLVAMDAAWSQWPILSVYRAEIQGNVTMMIFSILDGPPSLSGARE